MQSELTVDALAQEIRRVDGSHSLGAGALAEALMPFFTAAIFDQELAVEVKALEWAGDGDCYAFADVIHQLYSIAYEEGKYWANWDMVLPPFDTLQAAKSAAQADYEQRIRSALVDVPVEPVAKQWCAYEDGLQHTSWYPDGYGDRAGWEALAKRNPAKYQVVTRDLFASPPLPHREGEDSAEVERAVCRLTQQINYVPTNDASQRDRDIRTVLDALTATVSKGVE